MRINRAQYQDQINDLLDVVADKKFNQDPKFYKKHNTMKEFAKYQIHLCTGKTFVKIDKKQYKTDAIGVYARQPFSLLSNKIIQEIAPMISLKSKAKYVPTGLKYDPMMKSNLEHYKTLIREQNAYFTNYADFRIGGVSEAMLDVDISRKTVCNNILMSPFIVDMHLTMYTYSKDI
eukprot:1071022-Ditylum_brightwellii.AAC.1